MDGDQPTERKIGIVLGRKYRIKELKRKVGNKETKR